MPKQPFFSNEKHRTPVLLGCVSLLIMMMLGAAIYLFVSFERSRLLPPEVRYKLIALLALLILVPILILFLGYRKRSVKLLSLILSLILFAFFSVGSFYLRRTFASLDQMTSRATDGSRQKEFHIYVRKDSSYQTIADLGGKTLAAAMKRDGENIRNYLSGVTNAPELLDSGNELQGVRDLLDKKVEGLVMSATWIDLVHENFPDFDDKIRALGNFKVELSAPKETAEEPKPVQAGWTKRPFSIYLSGIDSYGDIDTVSRSDVNIMVTVKPEEQKLLLTSIPRDTYCRIAGDGQNEYDKLTHAGIYGAKTSMETLNQLLGTDAERYVKVNFSGLINIVDQLGGIEVDNPVSFKTLEYNFPAGMINLDGKQALSFSRERNAFAAGDFERGRNQERVLKAMMHKLCSPSVLMNYASILDEISRSTETNFTSSEIMDLVNMQISLGSSWDITMQSLEGEGRSDLPCYSMPGWNLYVMVPTEDSLEKVKAEIRTYS